MEPSASCSGRRSSWPALPQIVVTELIGDAPWPLAFGQVAALLTLWAAARGTTRLRALDVPLRWLLAFFFL